MSVNLRKVAVVGCGFVGSASAFALMQSGLFTEMVLLDVVQEKAEGEAMDIMHGTALMNPMRIYAGTYDDIADAAVIVVTAGAAQKPGETRLDLIHKNISILGSIMAEIRKRSCQGIMLVVSNPVDILTYYAAKTSGMPENRVFGSGTVLDTARLRTLLGTKLDVDSRSIHAVIVGEHGDSEIVCWSNANAAMTSRTALIRSSRRSGLRIMASQCQSAESARQSSRMRSPSCRYPRSCMVPTGSATALCLPRRLSAAMA